MTVNAKKLRVTSDIVVKSGVHPLRLRGGRVVVLVGEILAVASNNSRIACALTEAIFTPT